MIYALIIWLFRQYRNTKNKKEFFSIVAGKMSRAVPRLGSVLLMIVLLLSMFNAKAQTRMLNYQIVKGYDVVGNILFTESADKETRQMKMESQVKGKVLFITYSGIAKEETTFRNGVLVYSSIYRKMNGKEKANKQHQVVNNQYMIQSGERKEMIENYPITYNMLSLYSTEPVNVSQVYSENFQKFIPITSLGDHKYKISLPNGDTNYYYYKDGILNLVEANSTWYSVVIMLKK